MVADWGAYADDSGGIMCSGWSLDTITPSCQEALGFVTADVLGFDASYLEDEVGARDATVDQVGRYSWMVGDGFQEPSTETTYHAAANRTYLVATVFGLSIFKDNVGGLFHVIVLWVQYGYVFQNCSGLIVVTDSEQDYYFHCACIALLHYALHRWYHG
ncbi:unnamed protein product [Sordaria macrospora k-hell]|uniref:WGS project CABT00000000 data, contig 2.90 n=1 Tax=Sordaria macrospora (strain ATCC MYA-333 / DSM 997 / K(L3346) / K-hell) TaxID=771870 RepID=F7WBZ8_SORMK|nr:uncharacterized protein SMAC_09422 [Sordaria macrospora k-hell]CCC14523.1 unnamed protein product [Sordaria macrospora k-hell]